MMGASLDIARLLDIEPRRVVVELHPNGAVLLSQADERGLAQVLVVEPEQLRRIVVAAERMARHRATTNNSRAQRRRPEVAT